MSLHRRLAKLEAAVAHRNGTSTAGELPPQFWEALAGMIPLEQLHPETRAAIESLFIGGDGRIVYVDPIEERIREIEALADSRKADRLK